MPYLQEPEPERGVPLPVIPGVRRVVAANPGPMTYHGTNSYLIETGDGLLVLDPGPDDETHLDAVARAAEGRATGILLSHGHSDHCAGAARLAQRLGVPTWGHADFASSIATVDRRLHEGDVLGGMRVLWTPGHARDHICFARDDGVVFTGDQVMAWSSSVVPHPSGSMIAFLRSLERLRDRADRLYLPGHGPALPDPAGFVEELIFHRRQREAKIVRELARAPRSVDELTAGLYARRGPHLYRAARNNVEAHLAKLAAEGEAVLDADGRWAIATPAGPVGPAED